MLRDPRKDLMHVQLQAFLKSDFSLISDRLVLSNDDTDPIVIAVVKNEIQKIRLFFQHYRKLGVKQFVVLDNCSDDGTLEYLRDQEGTRVYQIQDSFQTQKKEAWIEKLLVLTGVNRWYVVVDSDELLDYVGSEEHNIKEIIKKCETKGYKRVWGFLLDMYSNDILFAEKDSKSFMTDELKYFDQTGYNMNLNCCPGAFIIHNDMIVGGPRHRVFDLDVVLSKQTIFFYDEKSLYRNCHYMYPIIKWGTVPCWFVLRHYKFLQSDKAEYEKRILNKNFYNDSIEYRKVLEQTKNNDLCMFYEHSKSYENSCSLRVLPYLQEIEWQEKRNN